MTVCVSKGCNVIKLMSVSNGKLILGLITFMAYYFSGSSDVCSALSWRVLNYCALAGIDYYKKLFLLHFPSQVMVSATGDTSGRAETSFFKRRALSLSLFFLRSLWRGLLLRVVTDPPASWSLRAPLTTLSPISNREAAFLQMQQLFQKQKMKRGLKSFSQFSVLKCLRTLFVDFNRAHLSVLVFFSPAFLFGFSQPIFQLAPNIH